jgi:competence protein ComEC
VRASRSWLAIVLVVTVLAAGIVVYLALGESTDAPAASTGPLPRFQVVFIDVGQGDSALITLNGERMLIDGGRSGTLIVSRLKALNVSRLDAVVATHPDADHAGGLAGVLRAFPVSRIYVNGDVSSTETYTEFLAVAAAEPGAALTTLTRGDEVALGGMEFRVLNPGPLTADTNEDAIVLRAACGTVSVLFTADAEKKAEESMLAAGVVSDVDVLKAGHHGSNGSSSTAFLDAAKPEVAVISAGRTNSYGHPAPGAMARLAAEGAEFEYTDTTAGNDSVTMNRVGAGIR